MIHNEPNTKPAELLEPNTDTATGNPTPLF